MNTYEIDLDVGKARCADVLVMRQGDHDGTTVTATLYKDGAPFSASGSITAYFVMELPGGSDYYRKAATYSSGVVTVTIDEEYACAVSGRTDNAYVELHRGTTVIASTGSVTVIVLPSATAGKSEGQRYDDEIAAVVRQWLDDHPEATTTVVDDSLTTDKFKDRQVTEPKLADGSVSTRTIVDGAVTTAKMDDGSVTEAKLAAGSVATSKLADGAVTMDKLDPDLFAVVTDAEIAAMLS